MSSTELEHPSTASSVQLLLVLHTELGAELRLHREPEHTYAAGALGAFGAVTWGVATLATDAGGTQPAFVAALGTLVVAVAVILRIGTLHRKYAQLRREAVRIAHQLVIVSRADPALLPAALHNPVAGPGYWWSVGVVAASAVAAIAFCLAVYLTP
jgi:hypothetical protein